MPKFNEIKPSDRPYGTAINDNKGTEFVQSIHTEQTGGMCMVDVIVMRSGHVLTITDEIVVVWPTLKSWENTYETGEDNSIDSVDLTDSSMPEWVVDAMMKEQQENEDPENEGPE